MRLFFFFALACLVLLKHATANPEQPELFEGKLEYEVDSGGMMMTYTIWFKEGKWRSELRSGQQLFELRLGDSQERVAYLVNEGGKSYRLLGGFGGHGGRMGPPSGAPRPGKKGKGPKAFDLEKIVVSSQESGETLECETQLEFLKGPGKKLNFWWSEDWFDLPPHALPRVKALEEKSMLLPVYLGSRNGLPLLVENGLSGKKAFRMEAVRLERVSVEIDFVSLPDGYKMEAGMMPGGGKPGGRPRGGPPPGGPGGGRPAM